MIGPELFVITEFHCICFHQSQMCFVELALRVACTSFFSLEKGQFSLKRIPASYTSWLLHRKKIPSVWFSVSFYLLSYLDMKNDLL